MTTGLRPPLHRNPADKLTWPQLIPGILLGRYKRFLADVRLKGDFTVTAHCPNTGSMAGCSRPGQPVYLSYHANPKRKYPYTWEMIEMPSSLVGVNTLVSNRLAARAIPAERIKELGGYTTLEREVSAGGHSRFDLRLSGDGRMPCLVEIKNCTLVKDRVAYFPDAVTRRGLKHLVDLTELVAAGNRCVLFFCIQRMDADEFRPADFIDSDYSRALVEAARSGVEIIAYDVDINLEAIGFRKKVPCRLPLNR